MVVQLSWSEASTRPSTSEESFSNLGLWLQNWLHELGAGVIGVMRFENAERASFSLWIGGQAQSSLRRRHVCEVAKLSDGSVEPRRSSALGKVEQEILYFEGRPAKSFGVVGSSYDLDAAHSDVAYQRSDHGREVTEPTPR